MNPFAMFERRAYGRPDVHYRYDTGKAGTTFGYRHDRYFDNEGAVYAAPPCGDSLPECFRLGMVPNAAGVPAALPLRKTFRCLDPASVICALQYDDAIYFCSASFDDLVADFLVLFATIFATPDLSILPTVDHASTARSGWPSACALLRRASLSSLVAAVLAKRRNLS